MQPLSPSILTLCFTLAVMAVPADPKVTARLDGQPLPLGWRYLERSGRWRYLPKANGRAMPQRTDRLG